ncbi:MAG: DUF6497 family protein [Pseudomonadota bacterium]
MRFRSAHTLANGTVRRLIFARTAAPEGGAQNRLRYWVRGCVIFSLLGAAASAQDVPSGQSLVLHEVLVDEVSAETWLRFRFVAPQIAREDGDVSYADAEPDFQHLCTNFALPYVQEYDLAPQVVVVTLMDRPVPFGQADSAATQFIEAFRITSGACDWEAF